ncbi:MAG: phosphohydrolase, partial [Mobilitalea sp.]
YHFCMKNEWEDVARVCITHSYLVQDVKADVGVWDVSEEDYAFMKLYIETAIYDDYDKLMQLCDSLASANGFCLLEKRLIDVHRRYGVNEYTVSRWNAIFEIKEYFENRMGCSIYAVLPNVKETTFADTPLWKAPVK